MSYGNIMRVQTTGASWQTAQQDNLGCRGLKKEGSSVKNRLSDSGSSGLSEEKMETRYGDIRRVAAGGASKETAKQDNLTYSGERASCTMAETDLGRMEKYRSMIATVGKKYGIAPGLIAAIISRESRAGNALKDGWGDYDTGRGAYNAWGLMQVDVNPNGGRHTARGGWDSEEHLCQGTEILVGFIKRIRDKFPNWSAEWQLKGGIAAYNIGDRKVHSYGEVDENTTGGDYSNDVVARAQWYIKIKNYY